MKPTINLYFDMEFTSLSPDAKIISLGIVSDTSFGMLPTETQKRINGEYLDIPEYREVKQAKCGGQMFCVNASKIRDKFIPHSFELTKEESQYVLPKSFYAEFTDFDIDRCDDWVKENVVGKLILTNFPNPNNVGKYYASHHDSLGIERTIYQKKREEGDHKTLVQFDLSPMVIGNTNGIKYSLKCWLSQFSDYQIQFVCDCGTFDWYHLLQLIGEWEERYIEPDGGWNHNLIYIGLPKLPSNISPVPLDLNDLIAFKKGITAWEAFELNREELAFGWYKNQERIALDKFKEDELTFFGFPGENKDQKHTALFDSKVIKAIYNKLISI